MTLFLTFAWNLVLIGCACFLVALPDQCVSLATRSGTCLLSWYRRRSRTQSRKRAEKTLASWREQATVHRNRAERYRQATNPRKTNSRLGER